MRRLGVASGTPRRIQGLQHGEPGPLRRQRRTPPRLGRRSPRSTRPSPTIFRRDRGPRTCRIALVGTMASAATAFATGGAAPRSGRGTSCMGSDVARFTRAVRVVPTSVSKGVAGPACLTPSAWRGTAPGSCAATPAPRQSTLAPVAVSWARTPTRRRSPSGHPPHPSAQLGVFS
jgi:hypothetical protein